MKVRREALRCQSGAHAKPLGVWGAAGLLVSACSLNPIGEDPGNTEEGDSPTRFGAPADPMVGPNGIDSPDGNEPTAGPDPGPIGESPNAPGPNQASEDDLDDDALGDDEPFPDGPPSDDDLLGNPEPEPLPPQDPLPNPSPPGVTSGSDAEDGGVRDAGASEPNTDAGAPGAAADAGASWSDDDASFPDWHER